MGYGVGGRRRRTPWWFADAIILAAPAAGVGSAIGTLFLEGFAFSVASALVTIPVVAVLFQVWYWFSGTVFGDRFYGWLVGK